MLPVSSISSTLAATLDPTPGSFFASSPDFTLQETGIREGLHKFWLVGHKKTTALVGVRGQLQEVHKVEDTGARV
jgi:hypothetical protein